ncbi:efflux RND transporter permease subunit [Vallitalea okinawensis]|uniref:efflux RND transporter permease subunit n=1 Tax=Vallitalea okinawensis TaxID=2078660 RepID=UPI000CFB8E74|nr:efflux RND transporter permease subunit [Vallitalea okinawensis]
MDVTKLSIKRPVTTVICILIVLMFGLVSLSKIPLDLFPAIDIPIIVVMTDYEGASPSEVEALVTEPLEDVLSTVSNVQEVNSTSSRGQSRIIIQFTDGTDMDVSGINVRERVDMIKGYLPEGTGDPLIVSIDPNASAAMTIGVAGGEELQDLMTIVDTEIVGRLERIEGVGSIDVSGGQEHKVDITLLPDKMEGYEISPQTITQLLSAENLNLPVGDIAYGSKEMSIRVVGEFESLEDIKNLPIPTSTGPVKLGDVAIIEQVDKDMKSYAFINGEQIITLDINKESIANTVEVAKELRKEIETLENEYPDLDFKILYDSAESIESSISSVSSAAVLGIVFAVIILFLFLRNVRSTLIVGLSIPLSIVFTFVLMYFMDVSLNMISLGGLTLGVGMLVDNSIVVIENIFRYRQKGQSKVEGAHLGTKEVAMAVAASTLTTIAAFLPIVFVEDMMANVFRDLSLTVTASLIASLVVALTVVPMLASKYVDDVGENKENKYFGKILDLWGNLFNTLDKKYRKLLDATLNKRKITAAFMLILFIATLGLIPFVGMDFMPELDQGIININLALPKGTTQEKTFNITNQVVEIAEGISEEKDINYTIKDDGSAKVSIDISEDKDRRPTHEVVEEIRPQIMMIPGAEFNIDSQSMGMMSGGGGDITIEVVGDDLDTLNMIANDFVDIIEGIEGTREVKSSSGEGVPEAIITIDREKAALYGLNVPTVTQTLQLYVAGSVPTKLNVDGTEIDLNVSYDSDYASTLNDIDNIQIPTQLGTTVTLNEIADVEIVQGPVSITRKSGNRIMNVDTDVYGISTTEAQKLIKNELEDYQMPKGYTFYFTGEYEDMMESFMSLGLALIMSIFLVFFILAAQFESFVTPFIVMFSVPYAIVGAMIGLFITGTTLTMPAMMGVIMLAGIVVNNAIVLIDYINQLKEQGSTVEEAILKAGPTRLRPILMTTMTTVLAMIPVAIGIGEGTEMIAPLAITVIGGLIFSTVVTLIIIPVNYALLHDIRARREGKKKKKMSI